MKILFVHNRYKQYGGEDVAVEQECFLLKEKGHQVRALIFDNKEISGFISKWYAALQSFYSFASARKTARVIKEFQPDIIHVHNLFFIASPSVLFIAAKNKIPVVLTLHNYRLICSNALLLRNNQVCELCIHKTFPLHGIKYKCYRDSGPESGLVTAITGMHKVLHTWQRKIHTFIALNTFSKAKILSSSLKLKENHIVIKPNFIPDPGQTETPRQDFFLFVGRIVKEKGVHILLTAFKEMPSCRIIIVGDGPEKESLERQFLSCRNIRFTGLMEKHRVLEIMKKCKALICPSVWYEGSPFTLIEAFATGTPVIASRLGSMAEAITDRYNGYHFSAGNVEDLKLKVIEFMKESENTDRLYKNARKTYLEKYHPDAHYKSIINIYEKAIAEN